MNHNKIPDPDIPRIISGSPILKKGEASAFKEGEDKYRSFIENLPVLFYAVDSKPPYRPLYVSPAFSRFGYPMEAWLNDPEIWIKVIHEDDREWVFNQTTASTTTGEEVDYEYRVIDAKGEVHWVRDRGCLIRDKKGNVICREGVILDITDRTQAERALQQSEERFRNLFENANDIIYVHDLDGNYVSINQSAERVFGYSRDEALKLHMSEIVAPEHLELARRKLSEKLTGVTKQTAYELDCVRKDGSRLTLEVNTTVMFKDGMPVAVQGIARDITERKLAEEKLTQSEEFNRGIINSSLDCIKTLDTEGNLLSMSSGGQSLLCISDLEPYLNKPWIEFWEREDRKAAQAAIASAAAGKTGRFVGFFCTLEGTPKWWDVQVSPIRDADGRTAQLLVVSRDITELRQSEQALRESEANLAAAQRITHLGSWELIVNNVEDSNENIVRWSDEVFRIFGYEPKEFTVTSAFVYDAVHPEDRVYVSEQFTEAVVEKKFLDIEARIILPDASERLIRAQAETVYDETTGKPVKMNGTIQDITEHRLAEEAIRESENQYRDLFENANDLIYTHDLRGNFTSLNRAGERITGYSREEALRMNISQVVDPESLAAAREMTARKIKEDVATTYEVDIIAKNGRTVSLELSTRLIYRKGAAIGVQGIGRDITERRRAEAALKASEQRYRQLGEGIFHQVWTAEPDGKLDYVNARTMEYFDRTSAELVGEEWQNVVHPDDLEECLRRWSNAIATGEFYEMEFRLRRHDGEYRWFKARANPDYDTRGRIIKWFGTNTDIDEQKQSEAKLNYYARHDTLTDLPNRPEFMNHLAAAIDRARLNPLTRFAVLFLDLDRFKIINDSLGHIVGDKLLKAIADRLCNYVRPGDVVARLGGDEFTILLNRTGGTADVVQVAERVQRNLAKPFQIDGYEVFTSASIGIIVSDEIMREPEDFLRDADSAMYRAKEAGKARYEIFDREMHVRNIKQLQIETDLRHAIERSEFEIQYQPIVKLESGSVSEFEALIRWRHPVHGLIGPDDFISVAEETGMIVPIGRWILEESCRQTIKWQNQFTFPLSISVNLSAKQLMYPLLTEQVAAILDETGLNPRQLKLEVTESMVMEHSERSLNLLQELDELGISLSTDDFGTGYSSLSYLQRFPFDRLKIDRSFVDKMIGDERSAAIVKTILMLGENLGIEVVAEGIETEQQLDMLRNFGCRLGQGYFFSRPVGAVGVEQILREGLKKFDLESSTRPINGAIIDISATDRIN